jgi:hypothetical protein
VLTGEIAAEGNVPGDGGGRESEHGGHGKWQQGAWRLLHGAILSVVVPVCPAGWSDESTRTPATGSPASVDSRACRLRQGFHTRSRHDRAAASGPIWRWLRFTERVD